MESCCGQTKTRLWRTRLVSPLACRDSLHKTTPLIDGSMRWLIERDWPVTPGRGHPPGRRSCWKLCWTFRCFACAFRSWPGSPESQRGFRGDRGRRSDGEVTEERGGGGDTEMRLIIDQTRRHLSWEGTAESRHDVKMLDLIFCILQIVLLKLLSLITLSVWPDQAPNGWQHQWDHSFRDLPV